MKAPGLGRELMMTSDEIAAEALAESTGNGPTESIPKMGCTTLPSSQPVNIGCRQSQGGSVPVNKKLCPKAIPEEELSCEV